MTATPNNLANPNYVAPAKPVKAKTEEVIAKKIDQALEGLTPERVESTVYETSQNRHQRRLLIDEQVLNLPEAVQVFVDIKEDGTGRVSVSFDTRQLQVIKAGNRIGRRRSRRAEKKK